MRSVLLFLGAYNAQKNYKMSDESYEKSLIIANTSTNNDYYYRYEENLDKLRNDGGLALNQE